jgi:hypothetical protein
MRKDYRRGIVSGSCLFRFDSYPFLSIWDYKEWIYSMSELTTMREAHLYFVFCHNQTERALIRRPSCFSKWSIVQPQQGAYAVHRHSQERIRDLEGGETNEFAVCWASGNIAIIYTNHERKLSTGSRNSRATGIYSQSCLYTVCTGKGAQSCITRHTPHCAVHFLRFVMRHRPVHLAPDVCHTLLVSFSCLWFTRVQVSKTISFFFVPTGRSLSRPAPGPGESQWLTLIGHVCDFRVSHIRWS